MAGFEERLNRAATSTPAPPPDITSLAREFNDFKSVVWDTLTSFKTQVDLLSLGLERHETFLRRKVLLLHGVAESKEEKPHEVVSKVLTERMKVTEVTSNDIEVCHRLGSNFSKTRPILVRFRDVQSRSLIWDSKTSLKGSGITLSEFLTQSRHSVFMEARKHFGVNRCWSTEGKIIILLPDKSRRKVELMSDLQQLIAKYPDQHTGPSQDSASSKAQQGNGKTSGTKDGAGSKPAGRTTRRRL